MIDASGEVLCNIRLPIVIATWIEFRNLQNCSRRVDDGVVELSENVAGQVGVKRPRQVTEARDSTVAEQGEGILDPAVDVTIKHPLAPTYLHRLAQTSLAVAREGERVKNVKYESEAKALGLEFVPFSIESSGGWGPAAQLLVKEIALHAVRHTHLSRAEALRLFQEGVAIAVQRGNAFLLHSADQRSAERQTAPQRVR